ncbi:LacI family DNA-binding transcriptional regulator, partial [Pantoea septica]
MTKVTMSAIAREAGVGVATVDRVLNQRAPVRGATEQKVLAAASRLGYRHAQSRLLHPGAPPTATLRMGFLLLSTDYSLYRQLSEALREQAMPHHPTGVEPLFVTHGIDEVEQAALSLRAL